MIWLAINGCLHAIEYEFEGSDQLIPIDDYYCREKFTELSIDLSRLETLSCCAADAARIDFDWLAQNPNQIFNTPALHNERKQMLSNQRVESCKSCWVPEQLGSTSRRQMRKSCEKTHTDLVAVPTNLHLIVGVDCNMSCVYCTKTYSSSWINDIKNNGVYLDGKYERFKNNPKDLVLNKLSQKQISQSNLRKLLFNEIEHIICQEQCKTVTITGGEPFLYLYLTELCSLVPDDKRILLFSGLGVNQKRFANQLNQIKDKNLEIIVSAESTDGFYEFIRFGNSLENFKSNLDTIESLKVENSFSMVVSNLTMFGLANFIQKYPGSRHRFIVCNDPPFLNVKFLDQLSKQRISDDLKFFPSDTAALIESSLNQEPEKELMVDLRNFLLEFSTRRKLSLDVFPVSFLDWLELD